MAKKTHDAVHVEKYVDRDGNEKKRYTNMGSMFKRDDGAMSVKIDSIPVNFSGWISFFEPRDKAQAAGKPAQKPDTPRPQGGGIDPEDEVPFSPHCHRQHW